MAVGWVNDFISKLFTENGTIHVSWHQYKKVFKTVYGTLLNSVMQHFVSVLSLSFKTQLKYPCVCFH